MSRLQAAIDALREGQLVLMLASDEPDSEGELLLLAESASQESVNRLLTLACGNLRVAMVSVACDRLELTPEGGSGPRPVETRALVSVDAAEALTTGISAAERARTLRVLADRSSRPEDLSRPGHVFPVRATDGGVLARAGSIEAAVDLAVLAGRRPIVAVVAVLDVAGEFLRQPALAAWAAEHGIPALSVDDLIAHRRRTECLIEPVELDVPMPTRFGLFAAHLFRSKVDGAETVALSIGLPAGAGPAARAPRPEVVPVRVHSECLTGDVFHSLRCDCGPQLDHALELLGQRGIGVLVYLRQEGRGIGLANKLRAYRLQDTGLDTVEANRALGFADDLREYGVGAQVLSHLGVRRMALLTNNPRKLKGLAAYGIEIAEQVPIEVPATASNLRYLMTKRDKLGHTLTRTSLPDETS
jgi:3,4-dihydroxy 2-butanone 4-phosphate synthase / GTP cyclohydrolase II